MFGVFRAVLVLLACAASCPAWVESVEFAWNACPQPLWERQLVWVKNAGFTHVSLPPAKDPAQLAGVIGILRRLRLEADLEGPVPPGLEPLTVAHGGPLTPPLTDSVRLSALSPNALSRSRGLLLSGKPAITWTDVQDTLSPAGFHPGAVNFAGEESSAAGTLRRSAQLSKYWGRIFPSLHPIHGAGETSQQFAAENGPSFVSVVNATAAPWAGEVKVLYSPAKHILVVPAVTVPPHDSLWLPVDLPLPAAFATVDRLVYATAELTSVEYENGILAMEFSAPSSGEVVLQLSREPAGPLVAGGKLAEFQWDDHAQRVKLPIPKGTGRDHHVRVGLAIEAPEATAFFESAKVLLVGETNNLTAEFSSGSIAQRSMLRISPEMPVSQEPARDDLKALFKIKVPATAVPGDYAELSLEADGVPMSHSRPQFLPVASIHFSDASAVRLSAGSSLPVFPATIPVNQKSGRELTLAIQNNSPEIKSFHLEIKADGLEFSPAQQDVVVGVSDTREVTIRVFPTGSGTGLHMGEAKLSGSASATEPVQFVVIPASGSVAYTAGGFSFLESARERAAFMPGKWLEFINKDNGQNLVPPGGVPFTREPVESLRMQDLENLSRGLSIAKPSERSTRWK